MKKTLLYSIIWLKLVVNTTVYAQDQSWIYGNQNISKNFIIDFKKNNYTFPPYLTLNDELGSRGYRPTTVSDTLGSLKLIYSGWLDVIHYPDTSNKTRLFSESKLCNFDKDAFIYSDAYVEQNRLLIPHPDKANHYMLFTLEQVQERVFRLYYSLIDLTDNTYNAEAKQIIIRKQGIMEDSLEAGRLTVCRHPNGKDWWLLLGKRDPNNKLAFQRFLINSDGVSALGVQYTNYTSILTAYPKENINPNSVENPSAQYSPNGEYYLRCQNTYFDGQTYYELMQFDRCTGKMQTQNVKQFRFEDSTYNYLGGAAFSPNSKYLYLSNGATIIQYDIQNDASILLGEDKTTSCQIGYCEFVDLKLAPDNRIYIMNRGTKKSMSVIMEPNKKGLACKLAKDTLQMPHHNLNDNFPYHPYYRLGKASCPVSTDDISTIAQNIVLYPNPTESGITISLAADSSIPNNATVECYDMLGRLIYTNDWTATPHQIECAHWQSGMYICKIKANNQTIAAKKFVKQ